MGFQKQTYTFSNMTVSRPHWGQGLQGRARPEPGLPLHSAFVHSNLCERLAIGESQTKLNLCWTPGRAGAPSHVLSVTLGKVFAYTGLVSVGGWLVCLITYWNKQIQVLEPTLPEDQEG